MTLANTDSINTLNGCSVFEDKDKTNLILVGNPNVGKSVIFGILTGKYVVVSNYPGTTVEVTTGEAKISGECINVIDTPGVANLLPMSEDEMVTRDILLETSNKVVLQVADSKNLARTLLLSLQLAEMEIPFTIAMNMSDEASERRINIDYKRMSEILGVNIIPTIAVSRTGIDKIKKHVLSPGKSDYFLTYSPDIETKIGEISSILPEMDISRRSIALMLLGEDNSMLQWLKPHLTPRNIEDIDNLVREFKQNYNEPPGYIINRQRMSKARALIDELATFEETGRSGFAYKLGNLSMHHVWGLPILVAVLYLLWFFVGYLAAGMGVDFLQDVVFGEYVNVWMKALVSYIPYPFIQEMLVGEYGILTMGITYAVAIVLPIVASFFLFFSFLEDSGYLPRLAIMSDKICKIMGLNGKAILPIILGLGCGTMAAISARILDTKKERLMAILLISLGIPCSAQLGVVMGMLSSIGLTAVSVWLLVIGLSLVLVGYAANKVLSGETSNFIMEIPPMRIPSMKNIVLKTMARIEWYLKEAVPLFMLATFGLFIINKLKVLDFLERMARPLISGVLGLPVKTTQSFLMGFLRRDYGAAGLLDMAKEGLLNNNQLLIAMVTITLFLPCLAQFMVIIKEKGMKNAMGIAGFILVYSFMVGGLLNLIFSMFNIQL